MAWKIAANNFEILSVSFWISGLKEGRSWWSELEVSTNRHSYFDTKFFCDPYVLWNCSLRKMTIFSPNVVNLMKSLITATWDSGDVTVCKRRSNTSPSIYIKRESPDLLCVLVCLSVCLSGHGPLHRSLPNLVSRSKVAFIIFTTYVIDSQANRYRNYTIKILPMLSKNNAIWQPWRGDGVRGRPDQHKAERGRGLGYLASWGRTTATAAAVAVATVDYWVQ